MGEVDPSLRPSSLAVVLAVRRTGYGFFQGGSRAAFVLSDSKSEGWEKTGNVSLETCSRTFEETRRIQDPVQVIDTQEFPSFSFLFFFVSTFYLHCS